MNAETNTRPLVLHVDDSDGDAFLVQFSLKMEKADLEITRLKDGEKGVEYVTRTGEFAHAIRPDTIILDLNLPRRGGFEVLEELRRQAHLQLVPVIMLSSSTRPQDRTKAMALGATAYMQKPRDLDGFSRMAHNIATYIPDKHRPEPS